MDFSHITLFGLMKSKLEYLSERQSVLAQNVANADTPHYKAQDIAEPDFKYLAGISANGSIHKIQMAVTDPKHVSGPRRTSTFDVADRRTTQELNLNGNNVVLEEEMSKVAMNQAEYSKVINLYSKTISMFKTAVGGAGSGQ